MVVRKIARLFVVVVLWQVASVVAAQVMTGIEVLREQDFACLQGKRVALVTNPTGVDAQLRSTADILFDAPQVNLVALFAPEHGIRGNIEAGGQVAFVTDERTGLPVYSLHGKTRRPTPEMLEGIDAVVYDIQDIGCRSYTFISTLYLMMEECAAHHIEVIVLDRPNPLGGEKIEGSLVDNDCFSFVSQCNVPYVYGFTIGELAVYLNETLGCPLQVVPMRGWRRSMLFAETGLPWVPTSPHIPHAETALYYPATGMLGELSCMSIGVGYTLPFQTFAAPWINADTLALKLNALELPGIQFRPIHYKPYYAKYAGQTIHGVALHITDYQAVRLTEVQFYVFSALQELYPTHMFWKDSTPAQWSMFDKVTGSKRYKSYLIYGPLPEMMEAWRADEEAFRAKAKFYYMYE